MLPKKDKGKTIIYCGCGYKNKDAEEYKIKEVTDTKKDIEIIEESDESLPLVEARCPKCEHEKAFFWEKQTRAGDEPSTRFFRCEKCKHTWREYS